MTEKKKIKTPEKPKAKVSAKTKVKVAVKPKTAIKPKSKKVVSKLSLLDVILDAVKEKKGKDLVTIDLRKITSRVSDFFVICNADSNVHVQSISRGVEENVKVFLSEKPFSKEGMNNAQWVLLDYVSVVVHIMQTQYRDYYNLEGLWADAKILKHRAEV